MGIDPSSPAGSAGSRGPSPSGTTAPASIWQSTTPAASVASCAAPSSREARWGEPGAHEARLARPTHLQPRRAMIVLQETLRAVFYAPFYAALALEAYGEEGVEVRLVTAPTPAQAAQGLADGSVDVGWGGPMRVMLTNEKDPACDLVCFCEVVTRDPFFLLGRTPCAHFKLAHLMGRRVAIVSEVPTPWMCLQADLRRDGLDPAKLDRVAGRSMPHSAALLRGGDIDVV